LPVPNEKAIEYTTSIAMALGCEIEPHSIFHRKNYFYPDMPKNYQISQYDIPIGSRGEVEIEVDGETKKVGITRVHLEEDTGKTVHAGESGRIHEADYALEDFNRAGTPLVEIVSEPNITSADEARGFAQDLRATLEYLGVSDVRMEEGSLRVDANISVAPPGEMGAKVEIKNMNSMRSLHRALLYEDERQRKAIQAGEEIDQATRHWDEDKGATTGGRLKEYSSDYRYFPEPDLVPIEPQVEWLRQLQEELPELPAARRSRLVGAGLSRKDAETLSATKALGDFFDQAVRSGDADFKSIANWIINNPFEKMGRGPGGGGPGGDALLAIPPADFAELVGLVGSKRISNNQGKSVLAEMLSSGRKASEIVADAAMEQISDLGELEAIVDSVIASNEEVAERIRSGDQKPFGFLVGQVMKESKGQADPGIVNKILKERLS
jgi:aspartyl-tRNA(Asn)/glutamyl-tRNA(Gln) amidotransferase subunit B